MYQCWFNTETEETAISGHQAALINYLFRGVAPCSDQRKTFFIFLDILVTICDVYGPSCGPWTFLINRTLDIIRKKPKWLGRALLFFTKHQKLLTQHCNAHLNVSFQVISIVRVCVSELPFILFFSSQIMFLLNYNNTLLNECMPIII